MAAMTIIEADADRLILAHAEAWALLDSGRVLTLRRAGEIARHWDVSMSDVLSAVMGGPGG